MVNYVLPKKMSCSCSPLQTHEDVVTEIALHLPVQYLLRCRAVCKMWRDVIDSPSFRKLHILSNHDEKEEEEDDDGKVYLQINHADFVGDDPIVKVPIKPLGIDKEKSLNLNLVGFNGRFNWITQRNNVSKCCRPVKGLICIFRPSGQPIAICNPFLGQTKILPFSPILTSPNSSCQMLYRQVAIGCDGEFYKVVELVYCYKNRRLHAHLYSRRTDSWRELGDLDQHMTIYDPIMLSCNDGHFAHRYATSGSSGAVILTFDMKNEVFRTTKRPGSIEGYRYWVVAKDDRYSFILIFIPLRSRSDELVRIYESSICEENGISKVSWNHMVNVKQPLPLPSPTHLPLWRRDCVILSNIVDGGRKLKLLFYDYHARRFIGCFDLPVSTDLLDYKGTFISP